MVPPKKIKVGATGGGWSRAHAAQRRAVGRFGGGPLRAGGGVRLLQLQRSRRAGCRPPLPLAQAPTPRPLHTHRKPPTPTHPRTHPPARPQDPKATKPKDWDEREMIDDPEDKKPAGWDDIPATIPDPDAKKPEDWDDEDDGEWEAPTIPNPDFKGEWKAKQ